jgi:hypothetical protein
MGFDIEAMEVARMRSEEPNQSPDEGCRGGAGSCSNSCRKARLQDSHCTCDACGRVVEDGLN